MPYNTISITHVQGDSFSLIFTFVDESGNADNQAGYVHKFSTRKNYNTAYAIGPITGVISGSSSNIVTFTVDKSVTETWQIGSYVGDLEVTDPSGIRTTILFAKVRIINQVTKNA